MVIKNMINTILFDLDGTLLPLSQDDFIPPYFKGLGKVFAKLGIDPEAASKAVWAGTKAMVLNDGTMPNSQRFWGTFAKIMEIDNVKLAEVETATDEFYIGEFGEIIKSIIEPHEKRLSQRIISALFESGKFELVLATNPLFPLCAVESRLQCLGINPAHFKLITHYGNSTFCKPNLGYYQEIFAKQEPSGEFSSPKGLTKLNINPEQCLMVGNNTVEDLCVGELGVKTFLITDFIENAENIDYKPTYKGTLAEFEMFVSELTR